jgi:hypothetical protein
MRVILQVVIDFKIVLIKRATILFRFGSTFCFVIEVKDDVF